MVSGGNLDNKRIGKGMTMYYPVLVEGALLSMGDVSHLKKIMPTLYNIFAY
jgi:acetamidase/formamidase